MNAHHPIGRDVFAASLLELLVRTQHELHVDAVAAKATLERVVSMVRMANEHDVRWLALGGQTGELATWQVQRVCAYIEDHLTECIHVERLSEVARRSTAHFCRAFKKTFGETPHSYIRRRRLVRSQRLMLTTQASLSEIALRCGFSDQAHFCNRFRAALGVSPALWRRQRTEANVVATILHR